MKRKVNMNRPKVSADEINQRRNFDSVLKNSAGAGAKPFFKKPWFLSGVVVATVAIVTSVVLMNQIGKETASETKTQQQTTAADTIGLATFYKAEEAKPCIAPPVAGLNIPYTTYKVNVAKGGAFDFKTGSTFTVPENAFVDENGKPVKGEVELRYREFHDAADFFVAGIPMTYDSAGVKYQFESAGMIEMLAYQDGKQVNMAPGKTINIELASEYKGTEYNLYELDTMKNNWSCLGKDKVVSTSPKGRPDSVKILKAEERPQYKAIETKKEEVKTQKETKIAALPKPAAEPKRPNKVNKDKFTFNLEVDPKEYPELAVYKGVLFEVGDENKNFNKTMYSTTWESATIKEGSKKGENYQLTLEKAKKKYDLIVYPVFEGKNYETAMKDFQDKFSKYTAVLDKRKADEKKIEEEYAARLAALKKQQEDLIAEWKRQEKERENNMSTEEKVSRVFTISKFGVYNCDNPSVYPRGVMCSASLLNENEKSLRCYNIYLVDKKKNGLFTYYKNPVATFSFDPKSENILWTVENGVLYYLKPEQFVGIQPGNHSVKMNRMEKKFQTVDEMKAFFNI